MRWLNYHHLFYFWTVAKRGSITEACRELRLSQPTVSAQIRNLEDALGEPLFARGGRKLALTEAGQVALKYADDIFSLGNEFLNVIEGKDGGASAVLTVGVVDVMPKFITYRLLEPLFKGPSKQSVSVVEGRPEKLLAELALRNIDLVLSDVPIPPNVNVKAFNHFLGQCSITFLAHEKHAKRLRRGFPKSLDREPLLLPSPEAAIRRDLDKWVQDNHITPTVVGEFQDSALMKLVAAKGHGVVPVATVVAGDIQKEYGLELVGVAEDVQEKFYLLSVERKIKHPAVKEISEQAAERVFAG